MRVVPVPLRSKAMEHVASLDCNRTSDMLASCDPSIEPPPAVRRFKLAIESASVHETAYFRVLAEILDKLVCSGGPDAIHVLRGLLTGQIEVVSREVPGLVTRLMGSACPVSAALTDSDKAELLVIAESTTHPVPRSDTPARRYRHDENDCRGMQGNRHCGARSHDGRVGR
jgi:hypothetical protein